MQMLQDDGHLQLIDYKRVEEKVKKVEKYLEYSKKVGTLD
jgi:hypothetical protein